MYVYVCMTAMLGGNLFFFFYKVQMRGRYTYSTLLSRIHSVHIYCTIPTRLEAHLQDCSCLVTCPRKLNLKAFFILLFSQFLTNLSNVEIDSIHKIIEKFWLISVNFLVIFMIIFLYFGTVCRKFGASLTYLTYSGFGDRNSPTLAQYLPVQVLVYSKCIQWTGVPLILIFLL